MFQFGQALIGSGNLNIRAVFLHVLADALGSVVVIISALLNKYSMQLGMSKSVIRYIDPILWYAVIYTDHAIVQFICNLNFSIAKKNPVCFWLHLF